MKDKVIGIDLGGTNINGAVVNCSGKIIYTSGNSTPSQTGREAVIETICSIINLLIEKTDNVVGIGIGTPGIIDNKGNIIGASPNIKNWPGTPLGDLLRKKYDIPVCVDNDANAITMGEYIFSSNIDSKNIACIVIGTGIGIGIILERKLFKLSHEMGHITINFDGNICGCGRKGCLESYVSATGLINQYFSLTGKNITPEEIFNKFLAQESFANKVINNFISALGSIMSNIMLCYSITDFIITGGIAKSLHIFQDRLLDEINERSISHLKKNIKINNGSLADNAGILGAASLVLNQLDLVPFHSFQ